MGLPPRSIEDEWGPGQLEISFAPMAGLAAADAAVLFRSAVKQVCQRRGLLASFMCRPALPNFFSSGWHLHQSLLSRADGSNAFASVSSALSDTGRHYVAGLLAHAAPMSVFAVPTVNGYKRFRPYSFAPDRVCWGIENRGVLVRAQGSPGDISSHVEMRIGEPAANPYYYLAANIAAGLDGVRRGVEPPPAAEADPYALDAPPLPASLADAVTVLDADPFYRGAFGDTLVSYLVMMKRFEIGRYSRGADRGAAPGRAGRQRLGDARVLRVLLIGPLVLADVDGVPGRWVGRGRLEVVAQAAVGGQRDQGFRGAAVDAAVGKLAADDDRAGFVRRQFVAGGQREPVRPGSGEAGGRVA